MTSDGNLQFKRREMLACLFAAAAARPAPAATQRAIRDMAGRAVRLPADISRVVTVGWVPVLNSLVFAFGRHASLLNGLPLNLKGNRENFFDPQIAGKPIVQGGDMSFSAEAVISLRPDVILSMDSTTVSLLEKRDLPTVLLNWTEPQDIKPVMKTLGNVLGAPQRANDYLAYYDDMFGQVKKTVSVVPPQRRPRVLFTLLRTFSLPQKIVESWIRTAGGRSVIDKGPPVDTFTFSLEQLLAWNPDILIVGSQAEVKLAFSDPRFTSLSAVRSKKVYTTPVGAHRWSHYTSEHPLAVRWAAGLFYPDLFDRGDLRRQTADFYERFFDVRLSQRQVDDILVGL